MNVPSGWYWAPKPKCLTATSYDGEQRPRPNCLGEKNHKRMFVAGLFRVRTLIDLGFPQDLGIGWWGTLVTFMIVHLFKKVVIVENLTFGELPN